MLKIAAGMLVSGFLFASGPCLASCGPLLISYIAGTEKDIYRAFTFYSLFSFSKTAVYLVLGLGVYFLGSFAREYLFSGYVATFGGLFIGLCGLFIILGKQLRLPFLNFLGKIFTQGQIKNPIIFGLIYGLIPCLPFLTVLSYSGLVSHNWAEALIYAFCFGLGTYFSPLLLLSIFSGTIPSFLKRAGGIYSVVLRVVCGLVIVFFGVQMAVRGF